MVILGLFISATLDNVTSLAPSDPFNYYYTFKVQCTSCRETHSNLVKLSRSETVEIPHSRGKASFVWKCRYCQRENSANIEGEMSEYMFEMSPSISHIISFECRGCEFIEFYPDGEWSCKGFESGTPFHEINLNEGEWYDYDEKSQTEVSITNIKWEIRRA
ncbi:unnamed protein product [Pneumocystis jirovecii]|uniref:DUF866-domain-containing protein n=3 Tax=Pneumocystis jirovecii TaxID=42068 RepID=L0PF86_PNEJI|nr:uncharacterized protein T551_03002 [Pneumocystis jirovecii RU7]KTW27503.1 hypothetical protein T551_03002 [Pneumocystis jirovecii RU7]CCJ31061.1 unnamed protein product [Pneumocystis jirovecii]